METAELELEYRLLKDKCTSVINAMKCGGRVMFPSKEKIKLPEPEAVAVNNKMELFASDGPFNILNNSSNFPDNYLFAVPDYLSVIDHLACDL